MTLGASAELCFHSERVRPSTRVASRLDDRSQAALCSFGPRGPAVATWPVEM